MSETLKALISFGVAIVLLGLATRAFKTRTMRTIFGDYSRQAHPLMFWAHVFVLVGIALAVAYVGLTRAVGAD